ncbi:uncharacterized protein LOC132190396 [Corylus avellana]|uniref:uncharacterized protein LOC132190396 n=1 Tax=Corylus avellana TaxID=13451 RepID=UPI00286A8A4B|nr:uncharacterized protein LOC132190396 [Corylus avellana]
MPGDWFNKLPLNSIDNFEALGRMFLTEFLPWRTRKRPWVYLLAIKQRHDETLKEFIARFNLEKMAVEIPTNDTVFAALYSGISPEGPLMTKLGWKQPSTLQGLMDIVEEFINEEEIEEILKAMASSRRHREKDEEILKAMASSRRHWEKRKRRG